MKAEKRKILLLAILLGCIYQLFFQLLVHETRHYSDDEVMPIILITSIAVPFLLGFILPLVSGRKDYYSTFYCFLIIVTYYTIQIVKDLFFVMPFYNPIKFFPTYILPVSVEGCVAFLGGLTAVSAFKSKNYISYRISEKNSVS